MLKELQIDNFAIIDHLQVSFGSGLITLTGETDEFLRESWVWGR